MDADEHGLGLGNGVVGMEDGGWKMKIEDEDGG